MNEPTSDDSLRTLLQEAGPDRFDAGFADRVITRLAAPVTGVVPIEVALARAGRRLLPWLAAAAAVTAMLDWRLQRTTLAPVAVEVAVDDDLAAWSAYQ
jgi:hypothetical protein